MNQKELWTKFKRQYFIDRKLGFAIDVSRMKFDDQYIDSLEDKLTIAYKNVDALEKGAIANPDEKRMVGHYWLRDAARAPDPATRKAISDTLAKIKSFAADVHAGKIRGEKSAFKNVLVVGIGGSALGPQFVAA